MERVQSPNISMNSEAQLSLSSDERRSWKVAEVKVEDRRGSLKVSDAVEMCKAQLLKQVDLSEQTASYQQADNTCL